MIVMMNLSRMTFISFYDPGQKKKSIANNQILLEKKSILDKASLVYNILFLPHQKFLKQQDQNLMRQFVKLRGVLNSIKNRPPPPPLDRKISLPETSPSSPISPLYRISEDSPGTYFRDDTSPGLRRRAQSAFAGNVPQNYPVSPLSLDGSDFGDDFEHFAI